MPKDLKRLNDLLPEKQYSTDQSKPKPLPKKNKSQEPEKRKDSNEFKLRIRKSPQQQKVILHIKNIKKGPGSNKSSDKTKSPTYVETMQKNEEIKLGQQRGNKREYDSANQIPKSSNETKLSIPLPP